MKQKTKKTVDILWEAIGLIKDKQLRDIVSKALNLWIDELLLPIKK